MGPKQIAVNLNMLDIRAAPDDIWTQDRVQAVLKLFSHDD